jgi:serine protease Do
MKVTPLLLTLGLFGVGLACGASGSTEAKNREEEVAPPSATPAMAVMPDVAATGAAPSLAPLVKALAPAVVNLEVVKEAHVPDNVPVPLRQFFGEPGPQQGAGSGFIISPDGYVLTNNHVIADATEVVVRFNDESTAKGKVIGSDPRTDVALVKIQDDRTFPFVQFGSSSDLEVGDYVVAIGNPFGMNNTVTAGIVSAKGRQIGAGIYDDFIQTDASINPGNSGGPLFNLKGQVVGINTAINAYGQGIAYAVPIDLVKDRIDELKTSGTIARGYLGVTLQTADKLLLESMKVPAGTGGALITNVTDGTPAAKAGLQEGDFIVDVDGKPVKNSDELRMRIGSYHPNETVALQLYRNGAKKDMKVKLGERPEEDDLAGMRSGGGSGGDEPSQPNTEKGGVLARLGLEVVDPAELRNRIGMNVPEDMRGAIVMKVDEKGSAAGQIQAQDVIVSVNGKDIANSADLKAALQKSSDPALMVVMRRGVRTYVAVPLHKEQ